MDDFEPMSEADEKYLAIMAIRKKIRKLIKKGDPNEVEKIEILQTELADLK